MGKLTIECEVGKVSDGYHTFDELYDHRCILFIALMKANYENAWYSTKHDDGSEWDGWLVAGINLPSGSITYHVPVSLLPELIHSKAVELTQAPKWDGHTSGDVIKRLKEWIKI